MRRPLVAGNWKMYGSRAESTALLESVLAGLSSESDTECVVFPPFVYLADVARLLRDSAVGLGAQNLCAEAQGAFTGEVSATMLKDVGCQYVIVGHSERRHLYGESDALVARKVASALHQDLTPIVCVGEQLAEREAGATNDVVGRQLDAVIDVCGIEALGRTVLAYEPVWAIGTGRNASPQQAQDVHDFIRRRVAARDVKIANLVRILYGGSVKAGNAADLFRMPDVDGGLIGGASLKADEFLAIVRSMG